MASKEAVEKTTELLNAAVPIAQQVTREHRLGLKGPDVVEIAKLLLSVELNMDTLSESVMDPKTGKWTKKK